MQRSYSLLPVIFAAISSLVLRPLASAQAETLKSFTCAGQLSAGEADAALTRLQGRYATIENFDGSFMQDSYLAALDQSQVSNGKVSYQKPSKMRWNYESPELQTFLLNGNTVWFYQPKLEQVMISEVSDVLLSQVPVLFLGGLGNIRTSFDLKSACNNEPNKEAEGVIIALKPKSDKDNQLQLVRLLMDSTNGLPRGGEVTDVGGNVTTILFSSMMTNKKSVAPETFDLKLPQGLDVQDTRNGSTPPNVQITKSASQSKNAIIEKDLP